MRAVLAGLAILASCGTALAQSAPSAFTTGTRYDAARRVVGTVSADPDGAGGNGHIAVRNTYDDGGRLVRVEKGQLANWKSHDVAPKDWGADFQVHTTTETSYDAANRKLKETVRAGTAGPVEGVTQYSYDAAGRLECTAVRMNSAVFGSLPASACTHGTAGSQGPDRIIRNHYDAANQLVRVEQGVGTDVRIDYTRYEYTLNGQQKAVIDANGNRAEFAYDGLDRRVKWTFPSSTTVGAANPSDYEEYGYDANGNRTSLRKRDGRTIAYAYDALNRVSSKTYPSGGARSVYYAYDLRGLQQSANFDSPTGVGVTTYYDGFGRPVSSESNVTGVSRILAYQHDANGNRTRVTHPDGQYFNYYWDELDRLYYSNLNSTTMLFHPVYDAAGRVRVLNRFDQSAAYWSHGTAFTYDGISRLSSYGYEFKNNIGNVATSFGYNPASQIISRTRNNVDYEFNGYTSIDRSYARNGLNQYTSAGSASFGYDANGNLTSDGTTSYTYDTENRLVGTGTGTTLSYDPLGRLAQVTLGASTTQFLYDGDALVAEYDGAGNMLKRYVHGPAAGQDDPLVEYIGSSTASPRHLYADHQGSILALTDHNGNRIAVNGYDEYGIPNGFAGSGTPNTGRFQYTGQAWMPELGMYHYKARVYSPTLGRFLQTDPIGYDDQVNLYAYVANDPVNLVDADGKQAQAPAAAAGCALTGPACPVGAGVAAVAVTAATACAASDACRGAVVNTAQAIGNGLRGLFDRSTSSPSVSKSEEQRKSITVYRLSGGVSGPLGRSWTTIDPRKMQNPRDALGLPNGNAATTLSTGQLIDTTGVTGRAALPLDGNRGGALELLVPNPARQIQGIRQEPFKEPQKQMCTGSRIMRDSC